MCVKKKCLKTTTPAGCKGTKNISCRQAKGKIIAEVTGKFSSLGIKLTDFHKSSTGVVFEGMTSGRRALCPCCGMSCSRVHSRRWRRIQCTEFLSMPSTLLLNIRHFYCDNPSCSRKTFSEPLGIAGPYSRMSNAVSERVEYESLNQSARLAVESLSRQHIRVSQSKCLRTARAMGEANPEVSTSGYVAIDDFAYRKGHSYMCAIIDLYTRRPLAVFDGRYGDEIAQWLACHPEIRLVSRDGSACYASIISKGAPQAVQVTDRFHLLKNLRETMVDAIRDMLCMRKGSGKYQHPSREEAYRCIIQDMCSMGEARHREKVGRYFKVRQMHEDGMTVRQISENMGVRSFVVYRLISRDVKKILDNDQRLVMGAARKLADIIGMGCLTPKLLTEKMGGKLPSRLVCRCTRTLRERYREIRMGVREANRAMGEKGIRVRKREIWSFIKTGVTENKRLAGINRTHPYVSQVRELCTEFINMVRVGEERTTVEKWVESAGRTQCREMTDFARYIKSDIKAVECACRTFYSNGPMEGTVNKIKMIKRTMFNRAMTKMLRAKVIFANYCST